MLPLSMCSNMFCFADLLIHSHKKELSGQQQHQLKSSWPLSGLSWHTKHSGLLVVEYVAVFLTCKYRLVYCMYFTAMEHCYSYRELKTRYYWSNLWPIYSASLVSLGHDKQIRTHHFWSLLMPRSHYSLPNFIWYHYRYPSLVCCYCY